MIQDDIFDCVVEISESKNTEDLHVLRDYQRDCVAAAHEALTGMGKTQVFSEIVRSFLPLRSLVLAHREELVNQAAQRLTNSFGVNTAIEMADIRAGDDWDALVSTIQTQCAGKNGGRMQNFNPFDFGLVVIDECHRSPAPIYRRALDYYKRNPDLKIIGVTATPDRSDKLALGKIFDCVAYDYEILDAIHQGWLVPIEQQMVTIEDLDYSHIHTRLGDLNGTELAAELERDKIVMGMSDAIFEICGKRKTLIFAASVPQAEKICEILNRYHKGCALFASGKTPKIERRKILKDFANGSAQYLVNCQLLVEGYDETSIEVVVQAFATKSRCRYAQSIGRATRPLKGTVDGIALPENRRNAIEASAKPAMMVLDFCGNAGKHKLITAADVLGGKEPPEVLDLAKKKIVKAQTAIRLEEAIADAKREIETKKERDAERKKHLKAKANYSTVAVSPFDVWGITPAKERDSDRNLELTDRQLAVLRRQGIKTDGMPYRQQKQLMNEIFRRFDGNLASLKQVACLAKAGVVDAANLTRKEAGDIISRLAANGWRLPK